MLDENQDNIESIADAIIFVHRNNVLPDVVPPGVHFNAANGVVTIDYGFGGVNYGSIEINRGQFTVARVTTAPGGPFAAPANYNHAGQNKARQDYIDALKCTNLTQDQAKFSALIIMTSESCRSVMVLRAIKALLNYHGNFSDGVWAGLQFAFNNYGHTCTFRGYDINAGGFPWTSLRSADYIAYIHSHGYNGDRPANIAAVTAAKDYIESAAH